MSKVRVAGFSVSLDGYGAGPEQSLEAPLGKRGQEMFSWFFHTKSFRSMTGQEGGSAGGTDDTFGHLHPRPQHVRSGARAVERPLLEGLVG
jgi:hypothetical protein